MLNTIAFYFKALIAWLRKTWRRFMTFMDLADWSDANEPALKPEEDTFVQPARASYAFRLKRAKNKQFYFTITHKNGKQIARSQTVISRGHCLSSFENMADALRHGDFEYLED